MEGVGMNILIVVLALCMAVVLVSCMLLLKYRNEPKLKHVHMEVPALDAVFSDAKTGLIEDLDHYIRFPQLAIAFEKDESSGTPFLVFKGAVRSERKLLYVFTKQQAYMAFMHACANIFNDNRCPDHAFEILRVCDDMDLNQEILYRMKVSGTPYYGVIVDDSCFLSLDGINSLCALIGIGTCASITFQITGDSSEYDWLVEQKPTELFPLRKTEERQIILDHLLQSMHQRFTGMTWNRKVNHLLHHLPSAWQWFYPQIVHDGDLVTIYDENEELVRKDAQILCEKGRQSSIVLEEKTHFKGFTDWPLDHALYDRIVDALYDSAHMPVIIPYRIGKKAEEAIHVGCSVIHFSPLVHFQLDCFDQSIHFYEKLLCKQGWHHRNTK